MLAESTIPLPATLSEREFFDRIETARPGVAVFDCDGTLWAGDAGSEFMQWTMASGLVSREARTWLDEMYRGYLAGQVSEAIICGAMVQVYRGLSETDMREAARTFFETTIRAHIFPAMRVVCESLRSRGVPLWAVSSTNNWVIEAAVLEFGIPPERVLAAEVRVRDGVVTDELIDVPTDEGKAESLVRAGLPRPDAVFGNSIHDAAMLEIAAHPFVVNPTRALNELAGARGWPVFRPAAHHA